MKNKNTDNTEWFSSKETKHATKIKDCDLMHYRIKGKLEYKKQGNAYLYSKESVEKLNFIINNKQKKH